MLATALGLLIATTCPTGPNGGSSPYTHVHRDVRYEVRDGTARIVLVDELAAPVDAHGHINYTLDLPLEDVAIVDAKIRSSAGELASVQLNPEMKGEFDGYLDALENGSAPDDKDRPWENTPAPALRVTSGSDSFSVEVAGPCSVRSVTVELELVSGSDWRSGRLWFPLPGDPGEGTTRLTVDAAGARASVANTAPGTLPMDSDELEVVLDEPRLAGRWFETELYTELTELEASSILGHEAKDFEEVWLRARAEVDIPSPMSTLEKPLSIAFVVDRSVSAGQAQLDTAAAQATAILDAAPPGSRYTVVGFARRPRVAGSANTPVDVRSPLRSLRARGLANGSDLEAAIGKARSILEDTGDQHEPRIVVLTDDRLLESQVWNRALDDASLTHALVLGDYGEDWTRLFADESARARAVERTGGIHVQLGTNAHEDLGLHLIRPTRIDRPQLFARSGVIDAEAPHTVISVDAEGDEALPEFLLEGQGIRAIFARAESSLGARTGPRLLGWVWATPLSLPLEGSARFDDVATAIATQDEIAGELPDAFLLTLAESSGAVTRLTPREAVPDWRQPPPPPGFGLRGSGGCGCGCCGSMGLHGMGTRCGCGMGVGRQLPDGAALLAEWLAKQPGCGASVGETVDVTIWDLEIMAVKGPDLCRAELLWGLRLDRERLAGDEHDRLFGPNRTYTVRLP